MYVLTLVILLQGLGVAWPASSPPLGMTVHVVPLDSTQGQMVRAHFTAIVSGECTDVTGLCADGEDCLVESNTVPFTGMKPGGGWCSHHWQKTLPANFADTIKLGSSTEMHVALKADPVIRGNSGKLNHPAFVGLPPPLRANEKCPHHFPLSVQDLDGDRVHCRFASEEQGECTNCQPHSFVELEQGTCTIVFNGDSKAVPGVYHIYLMAEDVVPAPQLVVSTQSKPMSAVPFILSLTVEEAKYSCSAEAVATTENTAKNSVWPILPFQQRSFTANYESNQESVLEVAVIGPPQLYRTGFLSLKPIASLSFAWVRGENKLARLLPICFLANTLNLQSEPRCVWLFQREMTSLPAGTVLTCGNTEMNLVLPISSFTNINLAELQLNSPDCPVSYNDTHLTATIPLEGCGTKAVHQSDELIYTNTLKTVSASTQVIRRKPILVLPLACRIPAVQASGPQYEIAIPVEKEVFGEVEFKIEFYLPGFGPMSKFTSNPVFRYDNHRVRVRRELQANDTTTTSPATSASSSSASSATSSSGGNNSTANTSAANVTSPSAASDSPVTAATTVASTPEIGSKIETLDLYVSSNCSVDRAEILVSSCIESETADFAVSHPLLDGGCTASESTLEVITTVSGTKIYRIYLKRINSEGSTMYVRCTVNLCITTLPSQVCPDLCTTKLTRSTMVNSVFSSSYTITSEAVSLVYTTPPPTTTTTTTTTTTAKPTVVTTTTTPAATTTTTPAVSTASTTAVTTVTTTPPLNTTSHAPEKAPSVAVGVMMALACIFLQPFFY